MTEVMWQPALKRGRGLEAQGYVVRVWDAGVYLLYSQVIPQIPQAMSGGREVCSPSGVDALVLKRSQRRCSYQT